MANQSNNHEESLASNLPKDAMVQILKRLPVKSLLQFKSVAKSWYNFLNTPYFIKLHLTHQTSCPSTSTLILQNRDNSGFLDLALLHLNPPNNNDDNKNILSMIPQVGPGQVYADLNPRLNSFLKLPLPFPIETMHSASFRFSYNGLICFMTDIYTTPGITLWNPATRKYKSIKVPSECTRFTYLKVGYVQESNDYKLLKVPFEPRLHKNDEGAYLAWIYTLSTGSWKTVPFTLLDSTVGWGKEISMNGFVYWIAMSAVEWIVCFDLIKDEFKLVNVPDDCGFHRTDVHRRLMVLRGSLAMMVYVDNDVSKDTEIWVMKTSNTNGVQEYSWTKKFIIEPLAKDAIPMGISDGDKLLVVVYQLKQVYTYDLVTKRIEYFHVPKDQEFASYVSLEGRYFESLVELEDK